MVVASRHGAVNWVDLSTPDPEGAASFYEHLLGWSMEKTPTPMGEYYVGKVGDREAAGLMAQSPDLEGMPAMWTVYFTVDDIDAAVAAVTVAGGSVMAPPFEIPDGARVAVVADPTGGMFGLITATGEEGEYVSSETGALDWVELLTRDPATAEAFYRQVFGWEAATDDYSGTRYTVFSLDGEEVAGMMLMPDEVPAEAPAHWSVYFAVGDCRAAETTVDELGGLVLRPTMDMPDGRFAVMADPQGATFQVMETASSEA